MKMYNWRRMLRNNDQRKKFRMEFNNVIASLWLNYTAFRSYFRSPLRIYCWWRCKFI